MTLSEDDCETLGVIVDRLDNATAASVLHVPDRIHKEALLGIVSAVRDELRQFLVTKGFNPWSAE